LTFIKIGITSDMNSRKQQLQTSNPLKLKFHSISVEDREKAQKLEKILHKKFKHLKTYGEWFLFSNDILIEIKQLKEYTKALETTEPIKPLKVIEKPIEKIIPIEKVKYKNTKRTEVFIPSNQIIHHAKNGFSSTCNKPLNKSNRWSIYWKEINCQECYKIYWNSPTLEEKDTTKYRLIMA